MISPLHQYALFEALTRRMNMTYDEWVAEEIRFQHDIYRHWLREFLANHWLRYYLGYDPQLLLSDQRT